jgi:hypothetical protein
MTGGMDTELNNEPALVMIRSSAVGMLPKIGNVIEAMGPPCGHPATFPPKESLVIYSYIRNNKASKVPNTHEHTHTHTHTYLW